MAPERERSSAGAGGRQDKGIHALLSARGDGLDDSFHLPEKTEIDRRLVAGSALFGAGWGLAGFCPGPAVSALSMGLVPVLLFVAAMAAGMMLHDRVIAGMLPR